MNGGSTDKRRKGIERFIRFCLFLRLFAVLIVFTVSFSSTFFANAWLAASLALSGNCTRWLLTDQTVLDFSRADISFITEQQL